MSDEIRMWQVDAFTSALFSGNPAAVCWLEDGWPDDRLLLDIAAENNLSETAFLVPAGDQIELRWMTPAVEVELCGHATLAAGHVVLHELEPGRDAVSFRSRYSGSLTVTARGEALAMDFPALPSTPLELPPELPAMLGTEVLALRATGARDGLHGKWLVRVADQAAVSALAPDPRRIAELPTRGLCVTAPGDSADFVSRFFAPRLGIDEDPVTGSAHCLLTPYWAAELGTTRLRAHQLSRRGGQLDCALLGDRVELVGQTRRYLRGTIRVR